jgi:hypothetical protein
MVGERIVTCLIALPQYRISNIENRMTNHGHEELSNDAVQRGHETSDANAKSVTINGLALSFGLMVVGILFCWGLYAAFKSYSPTPEEPPKTFAAIDSTSLPPLPRLQADPGLNLEPFLQEQREKLNRYGWVSRDSGIVHIPIERAMELVVKMGQTVESK